MAEVDCKRISITRKIFKNTEAHACSGMYDDKKNVNTINFTRSYACELKREEAILIVVEAHIISEKIFRNNQKYTVSVIDAKLHHNWYSRTDINKL